MFSTRVPDLDSLQLLLDVASTGSLGKAGQKHLISQPAVTGRIRTMERLVGLRLVERGPRGSTLTDAGRLVAGWAQEVLAAATVLDTGIASLRGDRESRLRVAASMTVAEHLLPGWLVRHAAAHPTTSVSLLAMNSADVATAVLADTVELGFIEGPSVPAGLDSQVVFRDRLVLVVPPQHPWTRRRQPIEAGELAGTRLVHREANSGSRLALEAALQQWHPLATPLLEFSTAGAVRAAVAAGAGPAVLSELAVRDDLATGRLVEVPVSGVRLGRALRAVWPQSRRPGGPARELLTIASRTRGPV
jgi:DNA-binding transcriptional LysR family regulator